MDLDLSYDVSAEMGARVSPTLIAVNQILALSSMDLQKAIKLEAEDNPAFDIVEHQTCPICGEQIHGNVCSNCAKRTTSESAANLDGPNFEDYGYGDYTVGGSYNVAGDDEEFDPMTLVAAERTMGERLMADLHAVLDRSDIPIAEFLIGSLDERGFLAQAVYEIAQRLGVDETRVAHVLEELQHVGPPGLGARDLRECLLLQLDYMVHEQDIPEPPNVRTILSDYLAELGAHKYGYMAQKLGISSEAVAAARDFIKAHLTPYPVMDAVDFQTWGSPSRAQYVSPDVVIKLEEGEFVVEVMESRRFFMRLNPMYNRLAGELRGKEGHYSDEEKRHIQQYVARAKLFMSNINQRRETMLRIARVLVEVQESFLRNGVRQLRPLTRAQVAERTGLHESTVSRATAGKYVMLPNRHVVPFADFFTASLSIKDVIKEIVVREGRPLTDREIVTLLRDEGIRVARRTVAKYRSQLGILPSTLR
ncbi:MAG: RNA polymerase factor sigma-54 [Chloroflexota bacterium]|nr:RNA polymerase factor sigma-54 [Chloroflexota bacterium]